MAIFEQRARSILQSQVIDLYILQMMQFKNMHLTTQNSKLEISLAILIFKHILITKCLKLNNAILQKTLFHKYVK